MILDQFPDASDLYSDIGAISRCAKVWSYDDHDKYDISMQLGRDAVLFYARLKLGFPGNASTYHNPKISL